MERSASRVHWTLLAQNKVALDRFSHPCISSRLQTPLCQCAISTDAPLRYAPLPYTPQQYVPLFLNKEDLDIAVQSAYAQRNAAQIKLYKDKADRYQQEYDQVGRRGMAWYAVPFLYHAAHLLRHWW